MSHISVYVSMGCRSIFATRAQPTGGGSVGQVFPVGALCVPCFSDFCGRLEDVIVESQHFWTTYLQWPTKCCLIFSYWHLSPVTSLSREISLLGAPFYVTFFACHPSGGDVFRAASATTVWASADDWQVDSASAKFLQKKFIKIMSWINLAWKLIDFDCVE